jgi:uncharacterized protein (UPF0216 family)
MDCHKIKFSSKNSNERINNAIRVFDPTVLFRILAFALHMMGAKRKTIAELVNMPEESVKTTIRVVTRDGFQAFFDRRKTELFATPKVQLPSKKISIRLEGEMVIVDLNSDMGDLRIPAAHKIQVRTILLTLMNSGLLSTHETALILEISDAHCRQLANKLACNDVGDILIDKRVGQLQDFKVGPTQKAEIIRQFAARAVTGHSIASDVITELVNDQTQASLTSRTIRWHMNKFGLTSIKNTLPELVKALKKTPDSTG